jgi:hypothetical protein
MNTAITTGDADWVVPLSEALRKSPTLPAVLPAVRMTEMPLVALSVPMVVLVRAHEYETPEGQLELQVGMAVKVCLLHIAIVAPVGVTATDMRVTGGAFTVSGAVEFAEWLAESFT